MLFSRHGEDVDERKRPWKGHRQKFPPPWAQDVDHRHPKDTGPPPVMSEDRDFRHYSHSRDSDYRDYTDDSRLEYTEDQDYRAQERGHHRRRKKRRGGSPETSSYKKSRQQERDGHYHGKGGDTDKVKTEEEQGSQEKVGNELPKPVPPPGVVSTEEDPPVGKPGSSHQKSAPPRVQPAPPGVDDWK